MQQPQSIQSRFWNRLLQDLNDLRSSDLYRQATVFRPVSPTEIERCGKKLTHFGSNDYLSLSWHPSVIAAMQGAEREVETEPRAAGQRTGNKVGSGASPLVTGFTPDHSLLEHALAKFEDAESAVLFSSGYAANVGTIAALAGPDDVILSDALNHASLIDGCRLRKGPLHVYQHADVEDLQHKIKQVRHLARDLFIVSDSLFSMDGDYAPSREIHELCENYDAIAIFDEAHATGVCGNGGRGLCHSKEVETTRFIRTGTLSKSIGCVGGFLSGSHLLCNWIRNRARSYIYSTALPLPIVRAATASLAILESMDSERSELANTSRKLRASITETGLKTLVGDSPIVPVYFQDNAHVIAASERLMEQGLYVPAIRPPTVPSPMLRISLTVSHRPEQIERLLHGLRSIA